MISVILHKDIDKNKWDNCIKNAENGLIYAEYIYLECMSKHWDAIILNDYEIVMPLTWNKKYGINYLYQPFFCASLGIFGNNLSSVIVEEFLNAIPKKYKYWDIYLNRHNNYSIINYPFNKRINLILDLNRPYYAISGSYSANHIKTLSVASKQQLKVKKNISVNDIIYLAKEQSKKYADIGDDTYARFIVLYNKFQEQCKAISYGVYNAKLELLASAVFLLSGKRAYYILVGNSEKGRSTGASHMLINEFIKDYSNKNMILDFEGSNVDTIARFYKGFGASKEIYPGLRINKLSPLLQLFRK